MPEHDKQNQTWWTTLPGIITAIATLVTAIGGLIVVLNRPGGDGETTREDSLKIGALKHAEIRPSPAEPNDVVFDLNSITSQDISERKNIRGTNGKNGEPNGAYEFDGQTSYMKVTAPGLSMLRQDFTVLAIIKNYGSPAHSSIVKHFDDATNNGWQLGVYTNNNIRVDIGYGRLHIPEQDGYAAYIDNASLQQNSGWDFIAFTYQEGMGKGAAQFNLYVNGNLRLEEDVPNPLVNLNSKNLLIGWDSDREDRHFHGAIDNITIYNRVLSMKEIMELYKNP